jgi:hypothetical protein
MIEVTIQKYLSLFPYLVGGGIVFNIWSEIADYRNIKKLKFKNKISLYGHALSFLIETIRFALGISLIWAGFISLMENAIYGVGTSSNIAAFIVFILAMASTVLFFSLSEIVIWDRSENAKLLTAANKELSKKAISMTDNEKKIVIKQKTYEYWQDLNDNFWKIKVDRTSK